MASTTANIEQRGYASGRILKEDSKYINIANWLLEQRSTTSDQAGRGRSSLPIPLGDYKLVNDRLPFFFDTETNGTGDGAITVTSAGQILASGFGTSRSSAFTQVDSARKIGVSIAGLRDELWLTIEPIQGSTNLNSFASIVYKEFI